jgi:hypothetical protein
MTPHVMVAQPSKLFAVVKKTESTLDLYFVGKQSRAKR